MTLEIDIGANLAAVQARIHEVAQAAGRIAEDVTLVAVAKTKPAALARAAISAGHHVFGENRVQEAEGKWPDIKADHPEVTLHLLGPLQRNKVRRAVQLFDVIETVDRDRLARALAEEMQGRGGGPDCYVQVNTGEESQKAGVPPREVDAFVRRCRQDYDLPVRGLMCIPPIDDDPALHFALLAEIAHRNELPCLSMGMTADFEVAIRFGATHVRVGTAIFGERPPLTPATAG